MTQKKKFKDVRKQMQEITKRKPTEQQVDDLKKTFSGWCEHWERFHGLDYPCELKSHHKGECQYSPEAQNYDETREEYEERTKHLRAHK